jgi:hypothetical protein
MEYGVSLLGVMTAVSFGVNTFASLAIWLNGALYWPDLVSTAYSYITP